MKNQEIPVLIMILRNIWRRWRGTRESFQAKYPITKNLKYSYASYIFGKKRKGIKNV